MIHRSTIVVGPGDTLKVIQEAGTDYVVLRLDSGGTHINIVIQHETAHEVFGQLAKEASLQRRIIPFDSVS